MKELKTNRLKKIILNIFPFVSIVFIVLIFFWKTVVGQVPIPGDFIVGTYYPWLDYKWGYNVGVPVKNPITSDVVSIIFPNQMLAIDMWKSGQVPLWNPYIFAGTPLLANFQSAVFSPTNVVYLLLDKVSGWTVQVILQHVLAVLFTYFLLRHWNASRFASVLGGIIYAFSGFNVIWSEWNGHTLAASFIPLGILLADKLITEGSIVGGIFLPITLAFLFFSGYPQMALYFALAIFLIWIIRLKFEKKFIFRTVLLGLLFAIGLGLSAPQTLPGAELLKNSQRTSEIISFDYEFLHWEKIITFIAPDFFGNHSTGNYWGSQNYTSNEGFVGIVALCLALSIAFLFHKNKKVIYAFLLMIFSLVLAFPTPVSIWLWKSGLFGLNAAFAHRSLILFNLSVAILAGFGIDNFLLQKKVSLKGLILPGVMLFGFLAYSMVMHVISNNDPEKFSPLILGLPAYSIGLRNLVFPIMILLALLTLFVVANKVGTKRKTIIRTLVFVLCVVELSRFFWKYMPFSSRDLIFPETPVIKYLMDISKPTRFSSNDSMSVNMRMPYKLESIEGYDATYPVSISRIISAVNSNRSNTSLTGQHGTIENVSSPILKLLNTQYILAVKENIKQKDLLSLKEVFTDKSSVVLENSGALPRAFMVYDWQKVDANQNYLEILLSKDFPYGKKILVENYDGLPGKSGNQVVEYKKYQETESIIGVETSEDGLLFISDTYFPGWQAYVDGNRTDILKADYAFRAISVSKGIHEIKMVYKPSSFRNGLIVSAVSMILLIITLTVLAVIGRKKI